MMYRSISAAVAAAIISVGACFSLAAPQLPPDAEPMKPPAVYSRWWQLVETCSGRPVDMTTIRWYRTASPNFTFNGHPESAGAWIRQGNRIVIAANEVYDGPIVRHEMLHAQLQTGGHPRTEFLGSCASLVNCVGVCLEDAGPWKVPTTYKVIPSESLDISTALAVVPPNAGGEMWITAWVSTRNPQTQPVLIRALPSVKSPRTFEYLLYGAFGGIQRTLSTGDSSTLYFGPLERKQWLFEFRIGSRTSVDSIPIDLEPGKYSLQGGFANHWSSVETVSVPQ